MASAPTTTDDSERRALSPARAALHTRFLLRTTGPVVFEPPALFFAAPGLEGDKSIDSGRPGRSRAIFFVLHMTRDVAWRGVRIADCLVDSKAGFRRMRVRQACGAGRGDYRESRGSKSGGRLCPRAGSQAGEILDRKGGSARKVPGLELVAGMAANAPNPVVPSSARDAC
jgi:hypothetical protein